MNSEPRGKQTPDAVEAALPTKRRHVPNLIEGCVVLLVVGVLASVCLPVFNSVAVRGPQTKALSQAKQIGLALKIFAGDNDGHYPAEGIPAMMTRAPANANQAFACLFPTFTTSEKIFGNPLSAYQTRVPDDVIDNPAVFPPRRTLEPGENVFGYVTGLTDGSSPISPMVIDGTDGTGHYRTNPHARGGVWKGERAIVIHLDNSGTLETLAGPSDARTIRTSPGHTPLDLGNLSSFGKGVYLLDPAVQGR